MAIRDKISSRAYTIIFRVLKEHEHLVPFNSLKSSAENSTQQNNANTGVATNMGNDMFDEMTEHVQIPTAVPNIASSQSAPALWPHGWPDDVAFPGLYPHDGFLGSFSSMNPNQSHIDLIQGLMASV